MIRTLLGLSAALLVAVTGCATSERELEGYDESEYEVRDDQFQDFADTYGNLAVSDARMAGQMGPVRNVDGDAAANGYSETDYASIDLMTTNRNGSGMHILTIYGGTAALQPGTQQTFTSDDWPAEPSALYVTSTNCATVSGDPNQGEWDWDTQADEVSIQVTDTQDPDVVHVTYETEVRDGLLGSDVSTGEFLIAR